MDEQNTVQVLNPEADNTQPQSCRLDEQSVCFSFRYLTQNRKHNFEFLGSGDGARLARRLLTSLAEISRFTWSELERKGKMHGGYEEIPASKLRSEITDQIDFDLPEDLQLLVFRFGNGRMLGIKDPSCTSVFFVLGFDWDYSLYNHGS